MGGILWAFQWKNTLLAFNWTHLNTTIQSFFVMFWQNISQCIELKYTDLHLHLWLWNIWFHITYLPLRKICILHHFPQKAYNKRYKNCFPLYLELVIFFPLKGTFLLPSQCSWHGSLYSLVKVILNLAHRG